MAQSNDFIVKNGLTVKTTATIQSTLTSTNTSTGALTVAGGVGVGGRLYASELYDAGSRVLTAASLSSYGVSSITAGTDTAVSTSTGAVTIWNTGTLQSVTNRGAVTTNQVTLNNGLILGSTANNPILMNGSYSSQNANFISATGTLVGTTTTNNIYAFNYQHTLAPVSTTTIANYYGQLFLPTLGNTATYGSMYGAFARIDINAAATSGSVASWHGFYSENPSRNAAADVRFTNHYGFRAADPSAITATNVYGFASQIASGTSRYNIHASGTADNYFNGNVGIGGLPTVKLDVTGAVKISGITTVTNATAASSTTTGALQVVGGVGVGGDVWAGNIVTGLNQYIHFGGTTGTRIYRDGGSNGMSLQTNSLSRLFISDSGPVTVLSTASSTSTTTGALTVIGGVGIGGGLVVGGTVTATNFVGSFAGSISGTASTASQINTIAQTANASYFPVFVDTNNASATGELVYTTSSFSINPSTGYVGIGGGTVGSILSTEENTTGATEHRITNSNTGSNVTKSSRLTFRLTDTVGTRKDVAYITAVPNNADSSIGDNLTFATRTADATPTEKLRITNNGGISFGASGTAYGTSGQLLQSNGDAAPTWVSVGALTAGIATTSTQVNTIAQTANASYFPTFVDSNNATATGESVYTTSSFSINPSTGVVIFESTTAATSTASGALQVRGGAGVGGDIYAGGDIYSRGNKLVSLNIQEFTATASQTTFTVTNGYTVGTVQVFANGIQLGSAAIVASNGTTVVLNAARNAGDIIRVISGGASTQANNIQSYSLAMSVALGA